MRVGVPHAGVGAVLLDQGIVRSSFSQAAVVEHAYLVRMHDGVQAVGDHDAGLVRQQVRERKLDPVLVLDVGEAGGFVEHDDGRILQDGASDAHALPLAAGQLDAVLSQQRVVAVRQALDRVVDLRGPRGGLHRADRG